MDGTRRSIPLLSLCGLLLPSLAGAESPRTPIRDDVPWALHPGDDLHLSPWEREHGIDESELPEVEPFWQGNQLFTRDSRARDILAQQGQPPLPASNYEAAPGILFLALDGVTLRPNCGNGDTANAALNCSPLVDVETSFPAFGSGGQQAALFNELAGYYDPFDIVLTTARPPEWVPYTMAVVGGSSGNAGQPGGVCGVANVACDGLKRNHVSLTFPSSCGSGVTETAAQETAHNWGLEHTDNPTDLLYPFNNGGFKTFIDDCMDISHATGDGITQCDYIHELYCGNGEQQNTYQELLGVFGPRTPDNQAPEIVSFFPESGSTFTTEDTVTITAKVAENSNFLAAHWTLEGGDEVLSRCTNSVCDQDYNVGVGFDPNEIDWDFVTLTSPPAGEYDLQFEVVDAYGGYDSIQISITVVDEGGSDSSPGSDSDSDSASASAGDESGSDTDGSSSAGTSDGPDDDEGSSDDDDDDDGDDDDDADTDGTAGIDDGSSDGCGCRTTPSGPLGFLTLMGVGLTLRRRRRAR